MAKITISEKDLTKPDSLEENDNVVYIPGYALKGPINTPTLCKTVTEFESIFGTEPFVFTTDQSIDNVKLATKGEREKSFIYAHEILSLGLPIIFTRIADSSCKQALITSKQLATNVDVTITAKEYGAYGNNIKCSFTPHFSTSEPKTLEYFDFKEYIDDETKATVYKINFDVTSDYYFNNDLYKYVEFSITTATGNTITENPLTLQLANGVDSFTLTNFYTYLSNPDNYELILDKNSCQVKYLTVGSYPALIYNNNSFTNKCAKTLIEVASDRGDCTALIDFDNTKITKTWIDELANIETFNSNETSKYAAAFMPWGLYKITSLKDSESNNLKSILPGSFAYLSCLAKSVKTNADWYAVAGVNRGYLTNLIQLENPITGAISESLQQSEGVSVNTILDIKPYGYCIWGNRTLNKNVDGLIASSFLNIRTLTNDIKKLVYKTAKKLTFEQNSNILWLNFKSALEPTLDKMVSDNGLADYKIIKLTTTKRATIACKIRLVAIEAVEDWDITIELADSYTSVE